MAAWPRRLAPGAICAGPMMASATVWWKTSMTAPAHCSQRPTTPIPPPATSSRTSRTGRALLCGTSPIAAMAICSPIPTTAPRRTIPMSMTRPDGSQLSGKMARWPQPMAMTPLGAVFCAPSLADPWCIISSMPRANRWPSMMAPPARCCGNISGSAT